MQRGKIKLKAPNEFEKAHFASSSIISKVKTLKLCMADESLVKWKTFSVLIILIPLCNFLKVFTEYSFIFDFLLQAWQLMSKIRKATDFVNKTF